MSEEFRLEHPVANPPPSSRRSPSYREPDPSDPVVISYSGGASSYWLIEAVAHGVLARPENVAVACADTGDEHEWTYEAMARVEERCRELGIPFLKASRGMALSEHLLSLSEQTREHKRLDHPPLWIDKGGGARGRALHKCTREFKVAPMRRVVSAWLESIGKPKRVTKWIGYSRDEAHRTGKSIAKQDVQWERLAFPAVGLGVMRGQMRADLAKWGRPPVRFSMCRMCPYKSDERWRETPESDLQTVHVVDEAIRDLDEIGLTDGPAYLTDALIPVKSLLRGERKQPVLTGLESYCDGGAWFL